VSDLIAALYRNWDDGYNAEYMLRLFGIRHVAMDPLSTAWDKYFSLSLDGLNCTTLWCSFGRLLTLDDTPLARTRPSSFTALMAPAA